MRVSEWDEMGLGEWTDGQTDVRGWKDELR